MTPGISCTVYSRMPGAGAAPRPAPPPRVPRLLVPVRQAAASCTSRSTPRNRDRLAPAPMPGARWSHRPAAAEAGLEPTRRVDTGRIQLSPTIPLAFMKRRPPSGDRIYEHVRRCEGASGATVVAESAVYLTVTISTWPSRLSTVTPTSCGWRSRRTSMRASPTARSVNRSQSSVSGSRPRENEMRRAGASMCTPSVAASSRKTAPAAQACGAHATGIERGILATTARKTANQLRQPVQIDRLTQIGHRRQDAPGGAGEAVARHPRGDQRVVVRPDRAVVIRLRVVAPLGRRRRCARPTRQTSASSISVAHTRSARSGEAIPANRQCPGFDVRTRHGRLWPSSASA